MRPRSLVTVLVKANMACVLTTQEAGELAGPILVTLLTVVPGRTAKLLAEAANFTGSYAQDIRPQQSNSQLLG